MQKNNQNGDNGRYSRLDSSTLSYFEEINSHLRSTEDNEEKHLIADNALEEAAGREAEIAADATTSRVIESLIHVASLSSIIKFTNACIEGDSLGYICSRYVTCCPSPSNRKRSQLPDMPSSSHHFTPLRSPLSPFPSPLYLHSGPFGSHVVERMLEELVNRSQSAETDEVYEEIYGMLSLFTDAATNSLHDMVMHKYGSFVARRLVSLLCGRDVSSATKKQQGVVNLSGDNKRPGHGASSGLEAKLATSSQNNTSVGTGGFPDLLNKLVMEVVSDDWSGCEMAGLQRDAHAGPFLQALLKACHLISQDDAHGDAQLRAVILQLLGSSNGGPGLDDQQHVDQLRSMLMDRNASHTMEVVFQTAPDDIFQKLCTALFKGHLVPLAKHPCANFPVQAAITSLRKPAQLKRMFEDLRPEFISLLQARRGGVVAALLAAALKLEAHQEELATALWHAASQVGSKSSEGGNALETLLTLDSHATLTGSSVSGAKLSTIGCAVLSTVFSFTDPKATKPFADALISLNPPSKLGIVAKDPGGCRVIEAYLQGAGKSSKKIRAILEKLAGNWGAIACGGGSGGRFVEFCFEIAEVMERESIVRELAAAEERLAATHRGPMVLKKCFVSEWKKGSGEWQKRVASASVARKEFEDLFTAAVGGGQEQEGEEERRQQQQEEEEEQEEEEKEEPAAAPPKKKKKKKHHK